jgi:hypothetical protein
MSRHYRDSNYGHRAPRTWSSSGKSEDRRHQDDSKSVDRHRPRARHRTTPYQERDRHHDSRRRHQDDSASTRTYKPSGPTQIPTMPAEILATITESVPNSVFDLLNNLSSIDFDGFKQCKGCNPPDVLSDKYPGYYDEPCTCTYCPSCDPLDNDTCEYDPAFPFYNGPSCTCTDVDNE